MFKHFGAKSFQCFALSRLNRPLWLNQACCTSRIITSFSMQNVFRPKLGHTSLYCDKFCEHKDQFSFITQLS